MPTARYQLQIESGRTVARAGPRTQRMADRDRGSRKEILPAVYRELILLRHSQDLSYDEIAEVTGLPLGNG